MALNNNKGSAGRAGRRPGGGSGSRGGITGFVGDTSLSAGSLLPQQLYQQQQQRYQPQGRGKKRGRRGAPSVDENGGGGGGMPPRTDDFYPYYDCGSISTSTSSSRVQDPAVKKRRRKNGSKGDGDDDDDDDELYVPGGSSGSGARGRADDGGGAAAGGGADSDDDVQMMDAETYHASRRSSDRSSKNTRGSNSKSNAHIMCLDHEGFEAAFKDCEDVTPTCGEDEICAICHEDFSAESPAVRLRNCTGHFMHHECIVETFKAMGPKCPTCATLYGQYRGKMPPGAMTVTRMGHPCDGYPGVGTIVITYNFHGGVQRDVDPSPGRRYTGTSRTAYLPDNAEGNEVLRLLQLAFQREHTFVVGTSITTGRKDTVVWNGIHHKTRPSGGPTSFGYPDATYFTRVKAELAAKGIS